MIYYPNRAACPNRDQLSEMSIDAALSWACDSMTNATEVSRLAEIKTWFGLSSDEVSALHKQALDARHPWQP